MKRFAFIITLMLSLFFLHEAAFSQMENIVVSPPPIPWYEFNKGQVDFKVGGNFVNVSSDDISINGGGLNLTPRYAFSDMFAVDFMFNYMYIGGDTGGGTSIDVNFINWNPNVEFQIVNNEKINMIVFLGYNWVIAPMTYWDYYGDSLGITAYLDGPQFGAQLAFKAGDFTIAPFFIFMSMAGDVLVNDTWYDVSEQTSLTFGFDVTYLPYGITLSGLLQSVSSDSDFTVIYIALSHNFQWGGTETREEETVIKPEKTTKKKTNKTK